MSEGTAKKFMFVNRTAPYGTVYALESLEVVLITAAFDQEVALVFIDDGVWQLKKGQQTKGIETKNFSPTYRALEDYDVEKLYVERESLDARGLAEDDLIVAVTVLPAAELGALMARAGRRLHLLNERTHDAQYRQQVTARPQRPRRVPAHRRARRAAADRGRRLRGGPRHERRGPGHAPRSRAFASTRCCRIWRRGPSPTASSTA